MTNEEIINEIKCLLSELDNGEDAVSYLTKNDVEWLNATIKALEQEPEDAISMMDLLNNLHKHFSKGFETDEWWNSTHVLQAVKDCRPELFDLNYVPPVQPKYNTSEWCHDCSEYNQDKHCCPRFNKVIRNTVEEIKQHCEDAISREDAMNMILGYGNEIKAEVMNDIKASMIKLPSVQ